MTDDKQSRLVSICAEWLLENLHHFTIDWQAQSAQVFRSLKPYGEVGLLAAVNQPTVGWGLFADLQKALLSWLSENPPNEGVLENIVREYPQSFPWVGMICQHRERVNLHSEALQNMTRRLLRVKSVRFFERHVGHDIAVYNILEWLNMPNSYDLDDLYKMTMLGHEAWDEARDTCVYYICHDIFYLSDWGRRNILIKLRDTRLIVEKMKEWYVKSISDGNIDLAAEILIALSYLRESEDARKLAASARRNATESGLPRPPRGQGNSFIRSADTEDRIQFYRNYHTVLVCLMALSRNHQVSKSPR